MLWCLWFAAAATFTLGGALSAHAQEIKFRTPTFDNPSVTKAVDKIVKDFEAANPRATVWAGLGLGGEFVKSGLALPMDKYYAAYRWDDRFLPVALSFSKQYPGGRFGVPYTFRAIYYNKALFQKAGITGEPKTYDELVAAADKLAKAGVPAFTFGETVNWHLMRLMDVVLEVEHGPEKHDALTAMKVSWARRALPRPSPSKSCTSGRQNTS